MRQPATVNVPKRHHYVPQMLLRQFTNTQGRLFFFNKNLRSKGVISATPKDVFVKKYLYVQYDEDGVKDYAIEASLAAIEAKAAKILAKIVSAARASQEPGLTIEEKKDWDTFFCSLWIRAPDVHRPVGDIEDRFRKAAERAFTYDSKKVESLLRDKAKMRRIEQSITANLALPYRANLPQFDDIKRRGIKVVSIRNPSMSFVIGSRPVAFVAFPYLTDFTGLSADPWLPLAPDVAVTPTLHAGMEQIVHIRNKREVRWINEVILSQSTSIASHSQELVASLSR